MQGYREQEKTWEQLAGGRRRSASLVAEMGAQIPASDVKQPISGQAPAVSRRVFARVMHRLWSWPLADLRLWSCNDRFRTLSWPKSNRAGWSA